MLFFAFFSQGRLNPWHQMRCMVLYNDAMTFEVPFFQLIHCKPLISNDEITLYCSQQS